MTDHHINPAAIHHDWDPDRPPALRIDPGDTVTFQLRMAGHGQIHRGRPSRKRP